MRWRRNTARPRHAAWLAALLLLMACERQPPPAVDPPATAPAPVAEPARDGQAATGETPAAPDVPPTDADESGLERALAAQAYLKGARETAEQRHQAALQSCRKGAPEAFDACEAGADEALQAELRAARAEFDARMLQPH